MSLDQPAFGRSGLCVPGGSAEPVVSARQLLTAAPPEQIEAFRPLLPVGYREVVRAYQAAVQSLSADDLTSHYRDGLDYFHQQFAPQLKRQLERLSGGAWSLDDFVAYAAGSDVDLMTHVIEGVASAEPVSIFPGDWYGFLVGGTHDHNMRWTTDADGSLACLCVPSVRNGQFTDSMLEFVRSSSACLLNINLYPTLEPTERKHVAEHLNEVLDRALLSVSFSRGFGMTASQLGVMLVHKDHPYRERFDRQWSWFTYFYNQIAARAFSLVDHEALAAVDEERRQWVHQYLEDHGLPVVETGSYYVKSFRVADDETPLELSPLCRDGVVRLCFKPTAVG